MISEEHMRRLEISHRGWSDWRSQAIIQLIEEVRRLRAENRTLILENKLLSHGEDE